MSAGGPPSFAAFTFANRGEASPRTPGSTTGSPWSSFIRSSPSLWPTVRSNSLPPTPSELRSTLGREENPFSAAFSVNALPSSHLDLERPGDNKEARDYGASGDGTVGQGSKHAERKRALSVPRLEQTNDQGARLVEEEGDLPPPKRPSFGAGAFGADGGKGTAAEQQLSSNSISDSYSGSDDPKRTPGTPNTSVEASPKPSLFEQLNAAIPSGRASHNFYQPAPRPLSLPFCGDATLALHAPSVVSPPLPQPPPFTAHQPFSFDNYSLQRTSPGAMLSPPLARFPEAAQDRRRSAPQPRPPAESSSGATTTRPPPPPEQAPPASDHVPPLPPPPTSAAINVVPGPKKRGRKPRDPNAPVDQEKAAKARLSALERNRIAASKSRAKKKEKAANAESTVADLSASNAQLQTLALSLRAELFALRQQVDAAHPDQSHCTCEHIKGYLHREATGGGIPTLDRLAGETLTRDYASGTELRRGNGEFEGMARSESGEVEEEMEVEELPVAPTSAMVEVPAEGRIAIPLRKSAR